MQIGVISDTHGCLEAWGKAWKRLEGCDLLYHAGDVLYHGPRNPLPGGYDAQELAARMNGCPVPVFVTRGNCDAEVDALLLDMPLLSPYFYSYVDGIKILMLHGTEQSQEGLAELGERHGADLVIFGHIHIPVAKKAGNTALFNPGSPSLPKNERATVGLLDTKERIAQIIAADEGELLQELLF